MDLPDRHSGFSLQRLQRAKLFALSLGLIVIGSIRAHDARIKPDQRNTAGERIGNSLENVGGVWFLAADDSLCGSFVLRIAALNFPDRSGRGEIVHDGIQDLGGTDVVNWTRTEDWDDVSRSYAPLEPGLDVSRLKCSFGEELLHQLVASLCDHLDQFFPRGPRLFLVFLGNVNLLKLSRTVTGEAIGFLGQYVDHSAKVPFRPDRYLNGHGCASEYLVDGVECPFEAGIVAVHLADNDDAWQIELVAVLPYLLGLHFNTRNCIENDQRGIGRPQGQFGLSQEWTIARGIQDVDLGLVPFAMRQRGADADLALDFLFFVIGDGVAFFNPRQPIDGPGGEEHCGRQGGFS